MKALFYAIPMTHDYLEGRKNANLGWHMMEKLNFSYGYIKCL